MALREQKTSEIPAVKIISEEEEHVEQPEKLSDELILENILETRRERATSLLNHLKTRFDVVSWDRTEVKIDGKVITDSNITYLVSDAVRTRKNSTPKEQTNSLRF